VIIPFGNARDLEELPEEVKASVMFHPVRTMDEVLTLALRQPPVLQSDTQPEQAPHLTH
jgi:ATP-dependent Lon protease